MGEVNGYDHIILWILGKLLNNCAECVEPPPANPDTLSGMGLDFSHCDAMWSYSGFNDFRDRLEEELVMHPWQGAVADPILILMNHSNCEGAYRALGMRSSG